MTTVFYWGEEDTSIHFCEDKYKNVYWVAEYYNTVSSLFYVLAGIFLLNSEIKRLGWGLIGVGVGSCILHATLRYYGQWVDEIAMIVLCFLTAKEINKKLSRHLLIPILGGYCCLNQFFVYFFSIFTLLQCYILYTGRHRFKRGNRTFFILYILSFIAGGICWIADQVLCEDLQSHHLHAWWHFFTAFGSLVGCMALLIS
jgi:hypothetical protein